MDTVHPRASTTHRAVADGSAPRGRRVASEVVHADRG